MNKLILIIMIALGMLSGCVKLPSPEITTQSLYPKKMRDGTLIVQSNADLSRTMWWKKMHDPTLNRLIALALNNNNEIKIADQNILQARAQLKASYYAWIPTLNLDANSIIARSWNGNLTPLSPAGQTLFSTLKNVKLQAYYAGFMPSYSFNILQNLNNTKLAKASLHQQQVYLQATKLSIISEISGAYFMLASQKAQLKLEMQLIHDQKHLRQLEKVRFQSGQNDVEPIVSLDETLAQNEINLPKIRNTISQTENAIHILLNQNPGPIQDVRPIIKIQIAYLIPKQLPSGVLKHRPDLMLALDDVKIASAEVGIAYSAFFPSISMTSLIGSASFELENLLKASPEFWVGQIAAMMKVFDLSSYQKIKEDKAAYYADYYNYIQTLRSVFADVDNSLTAHVNAFKSYQQSMKVVQAAQKAYQLVRVQYKAGATDYRAVLNARLNLDTAKLNLIQQKAQVLDSIVQVYQSIGGGYNTI